MIWNILFSILFIIGVIYLVGYRLNLKKAVEASKDALYPREEYEFDSILLPDKWETMKPLSKHSRSYQYVHWGTIIAFVLLMGLVLAAVTTDWFHSTFLSFVYFFVVILSAIRHRGNLYILHNGIILNGKFYHKSQIHHAEVEKIIRWHKLYGLESRVNNGYELTFKMKMGTLSANYVVVRDFNQLKKITALLGNLGVSVIQKLENHPFNTKEKWLRKTCINHEHS